jgi:iron complex outermembrane receptor protein
MVGLNGANQSAEYIKVKPGVAGLPILNSSVAQTPDWTMSANLNYRQPIAEA